MAPLLILHMTQKTKKLLAGFFAIDIIIAFILIYLFIPQNLNEKLLAGLMIPKDTGEAQIGIVLGAGLKQSGDVSDLARERVDHALTITESQDISFIFSGGETPRGIEAIAMNEYAKANGYEGLDHIEASSHSTYENAKFSDELLDQDRFNDDVVVVVTSPYHAKRAKAVFEHIMPEREILISYPDDSVVLINSASGRWRGAMALTREYLAIQWYKLRFGISL